MTLAAVHEAPTDQGTFSVLYRADTGERVCDLLELPWRENRRQVSCIPPGSYELRPWSSPKFRRALEVVGVPVRTAILIHGGNLAGDVERGWRTHSRGCPLACTRRGTINGQRAGLASQAALRRILALAPSHLQIVGGDDA